MTSSDIAHRSPRGRRFCHPPGGEWFRPPGSMVAAGGTRGFTLIELMVALALSMLVVGGALRLLSAQRQGHERHDAMVDVRQRARFSLDAIARDLHAAGLWARVLDPATVVESDNNTGPVGGTDTLTVRYVAGQEAATITTLPPTLTLASLDWDGDGRDDLDGDDFTNDKVVDMVVSEGPFGQRLERVQAIGRAGNLLTLRPPGVVGSYDRPMAGELMEVVYTVGLFVDASGEQIPCLYRERVRFDSHGNRTSQRQQLATDIDDLQLRFGGAPPVADDLAAVGAANVTAVTITVVARSDEEVLPAPAPFPQGQDSTRASAADRRLRASYSLTVALRN